MPKNKKNTLKKDLGSFSSISRSLKAKRNQQWNNIYHKEESKLRQQITQDYLARGIESGVVRLTNQQRKKIFSKTRKTITDLDSNRHSSSRYYAESLSNYIPFFNDKNKSNNYEYLRKQTKKLLKTSYQKNFSLEPWEKVKHKQLVKQFTEKQKKWIHNFNLSRSSSQTREPREWLEQGLFELWSVHPSRVKDRYFQKPTKEENEAWTKKREVKEGELMKKRKDYARQYGQVYMDIHQGSGIYQKIDWKEVGELDDDFPEWAKEKTESEQKRFWFYQRVIQGKKEPQISDYSLERKNYWENWDEIIKKEKEFSYIYNKDFSYLIEKNIQPCSLGKDGGEILDDSGQYCLHAAIWYELTGESGVHPPFSSQDCPFYNTSSHRQSDCGSRRPNYPYNSLSHGFGYEFAANCHFLYRSGNIQKKRYHA